jgi:transposase
MEEMGITLMKNGKRKWTLEQKMNIIKEFDSGVNANELCRKYNIHAQMLYKWKKRLESAGKEGLARNGEVVPKSQYIAALKKIEELERALGRKTLENDILKKSYELKGIKLPE